MSDTPDDPTDAIEAEPAADFAPPVAEDAAPGTPDPVETVTRKGAAIAMAGCLVVGGLIGWLGASAFEDDPTPISAFQGRGPAGQDDGAGGGFPGQGGQGFPGGPMGPGGGFPGGPMGPGGFPGGPDQGGPRGGGFEDHREYPPGYDEDGDDRSDDDSGADDRGDDQDQDDDEAPTTTESGGN